MKQQIVRVTAIKLQICNFLSILCLSAPLPEENSPPTAVFRFNRAPLASADALVKREERLHRSSDLFYSHRCLLERAYVTAGQDKCVAIRLCGFHFNSLLNLFPCGGSCRPSFVLSPSRTCLYFLIFGNAIIEGRSSLHDFFGRYIMELEKTPEIRSINYMEKVKLRVERGKSG